MHIDWSGPLTKGRPVFCSARSENVLVNVNFVSGFIIGWDRWDDGRIDYLADTFRGVG